MFGARRYPHWCRAYAGIADVHHRRALETLVDVVSALWAVGEHVLESCHPGAFQRAVALVQVSLSSASLPRFFLGAVEAGEDRRVSLAHEHVGLLELGVLSCLLQVERLREDAHDLGDAGALRRCERFAVSEYE